MCDTRFSIAKLNNGNYYVWKYKVELLLIKEEVWHTVEEAQPEAASEIWKKADRKARATIGLLVEDDQLRHIKNATSAKAAWVALQNCHQKATLTNQVYLLKRICNLKLSEGGCMEEHINTYLDLVDQLAALGEVLKDKMIIAMLLCSLPESYNTLIVALETRAEDDLTVELVKSKLIDEAHRRRNTKSVTDDVDKALKSKACSKGSFVKKNAEKMNCFFCKKPGHLKKDCVKYKKWKTKESVKKVSEPCTENSEHLCFGVTEGIRDTGSWFINSGATSHMANSRHFFHDFSACTEKNVKLGDGNYTDVKGIGSGYITLIDNKDNTFKILVKNVLFVPALDENLLSVRKLAKKGFEIHFRKDICSINKENKVVAIADLCGNLYKLRTCHEALIVKEKHNNLSLHAWHKKLGHRSIESIKKLITEEHATGVNIKYCGIENTCEVCLQGKMTRKPFPKKSYNNTKEILELIHSDVCGPMQTKTPSNNRYVLTLIDDYSRYTTLYLLKHKSEVNEKIKIFVS